MSIRSIRAIRAPRTFTGPIRRASDTWDWLTPEDVVRQALAAYYATCRRMERLEAHAGNTKGIDRSVFVLDMYEYFGLRIQAEGFEKGVCEYWAKAGGKLKEIDAYPGSRAIEGGPQ